MGYSDSWIRNTAGVRNQLIKNCSFVNNTATGSGGGAIWNDGIINQTVANCTFISNHGSTGGAIYNSDSNQTITNCIFINNTATTAGVMYSQVGIIDNCTFINNTAGNGGAISNEGSNSSVSNSIFINNSAGNGGAIYNVQRDMSVYGNTMIDNSASRNGGGIFNTLAGNMSVYGNTMDGNTAGLGQMIYNNGTMGVLNLTFIGNSTWVVKNGSTITLYATLVDDMGNTVTGQNISFYLNGVLFENVTSIEGKANITYTVPSSSGDIPVSGVYAGIGAYDILINNGLLQVRIPTNITISVPENVKVGDTVTLESKLTDEDGNPIAGATVDFYVDGVKVGSAITDSNGIAKLNYTFTKAGKPKVEAKFVGDNTYGPSNATNTTTVSKIPTTITVETNEDTITATLTDENGNPLANKEITITVNGKTYKKTTNSKGQVIIKYKNAWDYKVTANFPGDNKYLGSKATAPKRTPTKITIKKDKNKITATLTDKNGKPIPGKKLTFRVKGVIIGVGITDTNGQVVIYYKNAVTVSFEGDEQYAPSSATSTPESDDIQVSGKIAMKNTGIPIIPILLALIASLGILTLRKRE